MSSQRRGRLPLSELSEREKNIIKIQNIYKKCPVPQVSGKGDSDYFTGKLANKAVKEIVSLAFFSGPGFMDFGSGDGNICLTVASEITTPGFHVYGIEKSDVIFKHAQQMLSGVCRKLSMPPTIQDRVVFELGDILSLTSIPDDISCAFSFALGMSSSVINHILSLVNKAVHLKTFIFVYNDTNIHDIRMFIRREAEISCSDYSTTSPSKKVKMWVIQFNPFIE